MGGFLINSVTVGPVASRRQSGNHPVNHRPIMRPMIADPPISVIRG